MREVYLLIPLLTTSNSIVKTSDTKESEVERVMNITPQQYVLHEIAEDLFAVQLHQNRKDKGYAELGYAELEEVLREFQQQQAKISILESTLINYDWNQREPSVHASNIDSLMKKAIKYKEVKEENKKLKKLLQNQLENTEKVREETQKTMKVLREQFDTLVKQMSKQNNQKEKIKLHSHKVLEKQENFDGRISNKF